MFYLIVFLLFVIVFKNVCVITLAFSVEKEYYCYLEKEKNTKKLKTFYGNAFVCKCWLLYDVSLSYSAVLERHNFFLRKIMALCVMRKETGNL